MKPIWHFFIGNFHSLRLAAKTVVTTLNIFLLKVFFFKSLGT